MFDDYEDDGDHARCTLVYDEYVSGVSRNHVRREFKNAECYHEILEEFVWFLKSAGFTYIENIAVFDDEGEELYRTNI